jgi:hypothetical protein
MCLQPQQTNWKATAGRISKPGKGVCNPDHARIEAAFARRRIPVEHEVNSRKQGGWMMAKKTIVFLCVATMLLIASIASAQFAKPEIAEKESGVQKIQYIESGNVLYNYRWSSYRFEENGKKLVKVEASGDNTFTGDTRIEWTEETLMELTSDGLRTLYWKKKSTGAETERWSIVYDWNAKTAQFEWADYSKNKTDTKTIKLEQNVIAGDAMYTMLRGFPFEKGKGHTVIGQVILSDGMVIHGKVIHRGEEKLETPFGALDTYKLEIKPTGALGLVAPANYMWFTKASPHVWLRFDGRDGGLTKPRTKNHLVKFEPADWLKAGE